MKYYIALDEGTSSCRAILYDSKFNIVGIERNFFKQIYPQPGWTEHDPLEIINAQFETVTRLIENNNIDPTDIAALGITNQRETTIVWDKNTGVPVYNAIVWQDKRTTPLCNELVKDGWNEYINKATGLWIDAYFSATKIKWILDHVDGAKEKAENGDLLFGTIDTWLIWNLTKGKTFVTDYSNASRTMIFNIKTLDWDDNLLKLFDINRKMLPKVVESAGIVGYTDRELFGAEIPIAGIAGDQQAALFGQLCTEPGTAKNTYGTGCFILMNTGNKIFYSKNKLLSTIAWGLDGQITYAIEGSIFIAGAAIQWLRDALKIIESSAVTEQLANEAGENKGVYFVPAFAGLGAPYWDGDARGAIVGLTQGIDYKHIVRATLEALAYQTRDVFEAMFQDTKIELEKLFVDGGASVNNFLMQFQADIINTPVYRPENIETTALGAAFLAAYGTKNISIEQLNEFKKIEKIFYPSMSENKRAELYSGWKKAVDMVRT